MKVDERRQVGRSPPTLKFNLRAIWGLGGWSGMGRGKLLESTEASFDRSLNRASHPSL